MRNTESFNPIPGELLSIKDTAFSFSSLDGIPSFVYAELGRKATVYRMINKQGIYYALKVFHPEFRDKNLILISELLKKYQDLPGMELANRFVITSSNSPDLIKRHPDLEFAMLMPWIDKDVWINYFGDKHPTKFSYLKSNFIRTASNFAQVLFELEKNELAHTDISGSNVLLNLKDASITLVGLENMFGKDFPEPSYRSFGSGGYRHPKHHLSKSGLWCAAGDRFAGAMLICELLLWHDQKIREASANEQFFSQDEIGEETQRLRLFLSGLENLNPILAELFLRIWYSKDLESCPKIAQWVNVISDLII